MFVCTTLTNGACSAWSTQTILSLSAPLPSAADAATIYSAGFAMVIAPVLLTWAAAVIARSIRELARPQ